MRSGSDESNSWVHYLGLALRGLHSSNFLLSGESWELSRDCVIFLKHGFSPGLACKNSVGSA